MPARKPNKKVEDRRRRLVNSLKRAMAVDGLTQDEVGERIGVHGTTIGKWVTDYTLPHGPNEAKIIQYLHNRKKERDNPPTPPDIPTPPTPEVLEAVTPAESYGDIEVGPKFTVHLAGFTDEEFIRLRNAVDREWLRRTRR